MSIYAQSATARESATNQLPRGEIVVRATPSESLSFQEMSDRYFLNRSLRFAQELLLKEEYISVLYQSTARELQARRKEGLSAQVLASPLWNLTPASLAYDNPAADTFSLGERYQLWADYETQEYQRRLNLILDVRGRLIQESTAPQKQRLFKSELDKALQYYGRNEWDLAHWLFDRLIADYHYNALDDIYYYQAQACLQQKLYDCALQYYIRLLDECPNSIYRSSAYDRATSILHLFGEGREIRRLYGNYVNEGAPGDPAQMGGIYIRTARAEADLGHYSLAVDILDRVSLQSEYYLASRYLLADCLTCLEDWPRAVEVLTSMVGLKQSKLPYDRWRMLVDEARIKLAVIYYEWGEYEQASELFNQVRINSPFYDRVLLGKAWVAFQLEDYTETIAKTEEMLKVYPRSTEIYEASSLSGYCYEQLGDKEVANTHFLQVLEAGVGRSQLQSFLEERRRLSESMADLQALEEDVFRSGDEKMFADYKRARNQLWICQQRLALAELLQVNAKMSSLIEERVALDRLIAQQRQIESQVSRSTNHALIADFLLLEERIYATMERLKVLGQEQLKQNPLYYKEAQVGYLNARADSLADKLDRESERLKTAITTTRELQQAALQRQELTKTLDFGARLDFLTEALDQSYLNQTYAETSRRPALKTRVERWSDFSFNRYAMGGMDLEDLDRKYDRLKKVEDYLSTLSEIIDQRQAEMPPGNGAENPPPAPGEKP